MLQDLTEDQLARIPEWIEKWTAIGLSTEPADWENAEKGIIGEYAVAGLAPPEIVRVTSPLAGCSCIKALNNLNFPENSVKKLVSTSIESSIEDSVRNSVSVSVWNSVLDSVLNSVRNSVERSVWHLVGDQLSGFSVSLLNLIGGQILSSYVAWYTFFQDVCGVKLNDAALARTLTVQSCHLWFPFKEIAIVSDRPRQIHLNDAGQSHCEDDMAIKWPDGWGVWAINGVIVDKQVVKAPESQTIQQIDDEENEEVRRVRIERFGWQRYLTETNAKVIDSRVNDLEQTKEYLMRRDSMVVLLCHCPSTARVYAMEVPTDVKTCDAAQSWLWNAKQSRYGQGRIIGRS